MKDPRPLTNRGKQCYKKLSGPLLVAIVVY